MFTKQRLTALATLLTLGVIVLGAWVRLTDAGLGCPDWPGCYGHFGVPQTEEAVAAANAANPDRPVEAGKAWREMIHRYFAGTLVLLSLFIAFVSYKVRQESTAARGDFAIASGGVALLFAQAIMGMLTVIWLVNPLIVTGHLIMGMSTAVLFWYLHLRQREFLTVIAARALRYLAVFGLVVLVIQILLGGWTSTNYAALACTDFPTCQGKWLPTLDVAEATRIWRGLGVDYEGGVLDSDARVTIHFFHRVGAVVAAITLLILGVSALRTAIAGALRSVSIVLLVLLAVQVTLGILNVVLHLPLGIAVAHNGVAALLLLTVVTLNYLLWSPRLRAQLP